jgi:pimeloyl-ACP methyl ester carboxylesterase
MSAVFGPVVQVDAGELNVGFIDMGPTDGQTVLLLHGWPYDIHSYAEVGPMLADAGYRVLVPHLRGYGTTRFRSPASLRNGQQAVFAFDAIALLDALGVSSTIVAGFDWGARTASILAALWPDRCRGHVAVSGYLVGSQAANAAPLPPAAELAWWYQFYFATERGRVGYDQNRSEFARLIWRTASPQWDFDDATLARTASSFENPDHVDIVIHNYRWRLGLSQGEARYDDVERRLAERPTIAVPTITLEGDANGAPHPEASAYRSLFVGPYEHRIIPGGVGHNLPQEAPRAFADAVIAVDVGKQQQGAHLEPSRVG